MKYIRQFFIILAVTCVAELMKALIPLPVPASIYGLVLMFLLLWTGLVKLPQVRQTAEFLIEIMPLMFIPAAVGLLDRWQAMKPLLVPVLVIVPVTTALVMGITGRLAQALVRRKEGRHE